MPVNGSVFFHISVGNNDEVVINSMAGEMNQKNWSDVPELVAFNVTNKCNLRCTYCFQSQAGDHNQDASMGEIISVLDELNSLGVAEVLLEGGEIFVLPDIHEILFRLQKYKFRAHLITNGTLINDELAELLAETGVSIGVSLDGPTPAYNSHRGGKGVFYQALDAVKLLAAKEVPVYVNCTVTVENADVIEELIDLSARLGADGIVLQQLHCSGRADRNYYREHFLTLDQSLKLKKVFTEAKIHYPTMDFVESEIFDWVNIPDRFMNTCDPALRYKPMKLFRCAAGRKFCVIKSNLDVILCGILEEYSCGNLREKSFREIWSSSERLHFIRNLSEKRVDQIPGCKDCPYNPICDGGCRGDAFNYSGDWLAVHLCCPYRDRNESRLCK